MQVYNTLTKRKERLDTLEPNKIRMYVCGPTTYNFIHLGNARPLVVFDIIRRYLQYKGYEVTYVQNFTDVDDKIIQRGHEEGIPPTAVAAKYIEEYFKDADLLGVKRADYHPKVSDHIPDIIRVIETLLEKGHAYRIGGDVYYRVRSFERYGQLSGRSLEEMMAGARVEIDERKEDPMDFALWKEAKPGEPAWESPWGPGRPGWHIECSVMSMKYLGETLDIHGGGQDLIFPHHENEIAQSEAYTGKPFVRYWLHNGFITVNKEKMSKSLGNFFILREILAKYPPEVVRFYLGSTHYRSPLDFDDTKLDEAARALSRLNNTLYRLQEALRKHEETGAAGEVDEGFLARINELKDRFETAMDDDFNTAQALGYLFDMAREINAYIDSWEKGENGKKLAALREAYRIFTLLGADILGFLKKSPGQGDRDVAARVVEALLVMKEEAERAGNTTRAEQISACLASAGLDMGEGEPGAEQARSPETLPDLAAIMDILLKWRAEARKNKDFATADTIRDTLKKIGVIIEDTKEGARWRIETAAKI